MATIKHTRGDFEVSPAFALAHAGLLSVPHAALETERWRLLNQSNSRRLTPQERSKLDSVTHVINVHRALDVFHDVHHSHFGFEYADQLHGNLITKDCGCQIHYAFDHHARDGSKGPLVLHPHRSEAHCHDHKHLTDVREHHKALHG